jgi:hypothetical protein
VLAKNEPHHHPAYADSVLRVLRVNVPGHDTTLLHEHATDYFWIALGASEVVNVRLGQPPATIKSADLSVHYTVGKFAHVARNPGSEAFRNITVELLGPSTNPHNLCEDAVAGAPQTCDKAAKTGEPGVTERPAFETDQLRVALLTLRPGASVSGGPRYGKETWLIALDPQSAVQALRVNAPALASPTTRTRPLAADWPGGTWHSSDSRAWSVSNVGSVPVQVIEVIRNKR